MQKVSGFNWSSDFNTYISAMTWGHGYGGEKYWREEEDWLRSYFNEKVDKTLCVCCGLFRELETLKHLTTQEIIGLDYEEKFIEYLRRQAENNEAPLVKFMQGDVQQLDFSDNNFDLTMILFSSLGLIPNINRALQEMGRVTKKDGHLVISLWKDTEMVNKFRVKTYINEKPNRDSKIEFNKNQGIDDIVIYQDGKEFFRAGIFTKDYLLVLVNNNLPGAQAEFHDLVYSRILVIFWQ